MGISRIHSYSSHPHAQIVLAALRTNKRPLPACPAQTGSYLVYPQQAPIGATPAPSRRLTADAEGAGHRALAGDIDSCIARCGKLELPTPFYAAVSGDACYCAPGR